MTKSEAKELVIEGINYAAYRETDSSLFDSDKNRLYGEDHYHSGRMIVRPSPWAGDDFEQKMTALLGWAKRLTSGQPEFAAALTLLRDDDSVLGRVIRQMERQRP